MTSRFPCSLGGVLLLMAGSAASEELIIFETFTGYPDDVLISTDQPGPALGLTGPWFLDAESDFYVNRTEFDVDAGTGEAVYDRPSDDNGGREAMRATSDDHLLFAADGDVAYAAFRARTPRSSGDMLFTLELEQLNGGGQRNISFGTINGEFIVGNGGVEIDASGGSVTAGDMLIVLRVEYGGQGPQDQEILTLWIDPEDEQSPAVIDPVAVDLLKQGGARVIAVSIRGEHMAGMPAFFDNLLVARTLADIIEADALATDVMFRDGFEGIVASELSSS